MSSNFGYIQFLEIAAERIVNSFFNNEEDLEILIVGRKYCNDYCASCVRNRLRKMGLFLEVKTAIEDDGSDKSDVYDLDRIMDKLMPVRENIGYE